MATYSVRFTDINVNPIIINQGTVNVTAVDVALFGRIDLEYGQLLNANLLHLLENFACPEDPNNPGNPDLTIATIDTLSNPTDGQLWYNSTQSVPFMWIGSSWEAIGSSADFAANSGRILDGQQLPLPVSSSGYQFTYNECIWAVSPSGNNAGFSYMVCTTNDAGLVNHKYGALGSNILSSGVANYIIIGIKGSSNRVAPYNYNNNPPPPPPPVNLSPTPTPSVTPTPAGGASPTPSATRTFTPTPTSSPPPSPTPSQTVFPTPTPSPTASAIPPVRALVYINPSVGYSSRFGGPTSLQPCAFGDNNSAGACKQALNLVIADITGGSGGPYTIGINVNWFYSSFDNDSGQPNTAPPTGFSPSSGVTFSGSVNGYNVFMNTTVANIAGGAGINLAAYLQANYNVPVGSNLGSTVTLSIAPGSRILITDSSGCSNLQNIACANHVIQYYTPGGSNGQVQATQLTSPPSSGYVDSYNVQLQKNTLPVVGGQRV